MDEVAGAHLAIPTGPSAHVDTYVRDNLPPVVDWPQLDYSTLHTLASYPAHINAAVELLDRHVREGRGARPAIWFERQTITYADLLVRANRLARVLAEDLAVVPGNRVLLRGFTSPSMVIAWLAVLKVGAVVVTTMPLLRARELAEVIDKARVGVALCDGRLVEELRLAEQRLSEVPDAPRPRTVLFGPEAGADSLESMMATKPDDFPNVATAADDACLIAFTSGTTGKPKGAVHFHRDVLAICDTFGAEVLKPSADDVFAGSPPLAFTYGLGGLLTFPFRVGAATALIEQVSPQALLQTVQDAQVTTLFSSPTMYRSLVDLVPQFDLSRLKDCVSAGEPLPLPTFRAWERATGLQIIDGLGSTELLHIFITAARDDIVPGATGKVVPGYEARVVDDQGNPLPPGEVGLLAVRGPTGCRYLNDPERQRGYVRGGWNYTGDAYTQDERGYFWFQSRADDMIISAGYNIAGIEIESVLLDHPNVKECGVVGAPDPARGNIVKAFVVLRDPSGAGTEMVRELQDYVKRQIAPYKYPRAIEFVAQLPRTETGKLQRYKLRLGAS
ncbi:MAG TPA: AMP-binding protein [Chloroflexota bacterium]|nr:AMP-binding protein [Chloroflexota bacterium]